VLSKNRFDIRTFFLQSLIPSFHILGFIFEKRYNCRSQLSDSRSEPTAELATSPMDDTVNRVETPITLINNKTGYENINIGRTYRTIVKGFHNML